MDSRLAIVVSIVLAVASSTGAGAQEANSGKSNGTVATREARQYHRDGVSAYADGRYAEAVTAFLAADRLRPSPALSFNIAKAYEREGDAAEALQHYREYLHRTGKPPDRAAVQSRIEELALHLGKTGVQQVSFRTEPTAAGVLVDGEPVGRSPTFVELRPGPHRVTFRHDGYEDAELEFELNADQPLDVSITLVPMIGSASASASANEAAPVRQPTRVVRLTRGQGQAAVHEMTPARTARAKSERRTRSNTTRTLGFVALGAGVAALGGAVTVEIMRRQAENEAKQEREQVRFARALDEMESRQTLARVLAGAGGVLAAVGGVLVVTALGREDNKPKEGLALNCAPKKCAATYSGAF